jgi:transposase-like protein
MRDTHKKTGRLSAREEQLIQKMRQQPEMMERVESIFNAAYSSGKTADEIEEMLIREIRQLGQTTMQSWAIRTEQKLAEELKRKESSAVVAKKKR